MGIRGISPREKKYTPLGKVLREIKFENADREPAFGRGIDWGHGRCESCGNKTNLIKVARQCGECYIKERNG